MINLNNTVSIIVLYDPNLNRLKRLLKSITSQVKVTYVIVNSALNNDIKRLINSFSNIKLFPLNENMGLAYAQNIGIQVAIEDHFKFAVLFDQDTIPNNNFLKKISNFAKLNIDDIQSMAAIGCASVDSRTGQTSRILNFNKSNFEVDFAISSGTLLNLSVLINTGGMRSNYFIDHIDTEWCLRAKLHKYKIFENRDVLIEHNLGDDVKNIWFFRWRNVHIHSPLRNYYMFRNTFLLIKDLPLLPSIKKILLLTRLLKFILYYFIISSQRFTHIKYILLGIIHGCKGISGKFNTTNQSIIKIKRLKIDP